MSYDFRFSMGLMVSFAMIFTVMKTTAFVISSSTTQYNHQQSLCSNSRRRYRSLPPFGAVAEAEEIYYKSHRGGKPSSSSSLSSVNSTSTTRTPLDRNNNNNNYSNKMNNDDEWISTISGGFLPKLSVHSIQQIEDVYGRTSIESIDQGIYQRTNQHLQSVPVPKSVDVTTSINNNIEFNSQTQTQTQTPMNQYLPKASTSTSSATITVPTNPQQTQPTTTKKNYSIYEVRSIQDYQNVVLNEKDCIVVVRFYASWCRACQVIAPYYRQQLPMKFPTIKFVEVPLTKENAYLHSQLNIPSLPYAHIYYPTATSTTGTTKNTIGGAVQLVEESKINRKVFFDFVKVLQTYYQGYCLLDSRGSSSTSSTSSVSVNIDASD